MDQSRSNSFFSTMVCTAVMAIAVGSGPALAQDADDSATATVEVASLADFQRLVSQEDDIDAHGRLYIAMLVDTDPVNGMAYGIHGREGDPAYYDDRLPDTSGTGWANRKLGHAIMRDRLRQIDPADLSAEAQVDFRILEHRVALRMLEVSELQAHWDPLTYVSGRSNAFAGLGTAFSYLLLRDYAPPEQRLRSFGRRCEATPQFLFDARRMLDDKEKVRPTAVSKQVTLSRLKGMTGEAGLFRKSMPDLLAKSNIGEAERASILASCETAVAAIDRFARWVESDILERESGEWRLGPTLYARKYALYMDYPLGPEELLAAAEADLDRVSSEMAAVAREIHDGFLADAIEAGSVEKAADLSDRVVIGNVLARVSEDRSTPDELIADSYAMADAIVGFVNDNELLDLPPTSKMRIEDIPPFLSGYAVAQIVTAPPFEPELPSVWFWDLPMLRTDASFLKEYNRPALAEVYIHEGVPGHFVQLEYSNRFPRVIPRVFRNGPMVEGWATYIQTQLVDLGFTVYPDSPYGRQIQFLVDRKLVLRSIINAIIDIRLHTTDWPEDEAVALMMERGFQEEGEARGKLTRAKLSSVQLATYYAGHRAILELLEEYRAKAGDDFTWKAFNERLVTAGSPPFFALRERMLETP